MINPLSSKHLSRWLLSVWIAVAVLMPTLAKAGTTLNTGFDKTKSESGLEGADVATIVGGIINGLLGLIGVIFLVLLVYAGFLWSMAGGNQERVAKAKKIIVGAVIGMILVLSAYTIADFALITLSRTDIVGTEEVGEFDIDDMGIEECPDGDCSGLDLIED